METLIATASLNVNATLTAPIGVGTTTAQVPFTATATFGSGTGANNINQLFSQQYLLAAGASLTLVLSTMSLATDPAGQAYTLADVKGLFLQMQGNLGASYIATAVTGASNSGATTFVAGETLAVAGGTGTPCILSILTVAAGVPSTFGITPPTGTFVPGGPGSYTIAPSLSNVLLVEYKYVATAVIGGSGAGTGYIVGDILTVLKGGGVLAAMGGNAIVRVTSVSAIGAVTGVLLLYGGVYTTNPSTLTNQQPTGGTGTGVYLTLTMSAASTAAGTGAYATMTSAVVTATTPPTYTETDFLTIGNAGSNPWMGLLPGTSTKIVKGGTSAIPGLWVEMDGGAIGYTITPGWSEQLKITNNGNNPAAFNFVLLGATG